MATTALTVEKYVENIPEHFRDAFVKLKDTIARNLPPGFEECITYGMPTFAIPLSVYPQGYHCKADTPLMMISMAAQKNFIALYHMGIYGSPELLEWFTKEWPKHEKSKLDMGKSCIRFKKPEQIPYELIAELSQKISPEQWIEAYEKNFNSRNS